MVPLTSISGTIACACRTLAKTARKTSAALGCMLCRNADDPEGATMDPLADSDYPAALDVDYPDRPLNRLTTFFRSFTIIPIAIVLTTVSGATQIYSGGG